MKAAAPGLVLSDRLNAVLVRDVQQMLNGRAFIAVLALSLLAVLVLGAVIATLPDAESGRDAFLFVMLVLAPVLTLVVPIQAFLSARQEVRGGASELLLLSGITPARIVWGKLLSASVQLVLWTSVFAPAVAFTFLLRGVSVVQIGAALALAMLVGLTMSAAGIALGTLTVFRRVAQLVNVLSLLLIACGTFFFAGFLTFGLSGFAASSDLLLESFAWMTFSAAGLLVLLVLVAASQFTHPYENRSTGFRCFLWVAVPACFLMCLLTVDRHSLTTAVPGLVATLLAVGIVFFVFAATEEAGLSPRVRAQVPRRTGRALLLAPFLPGHGRGLLYSLLMVTLLLGISRIGIALGSGTVDADVVGAGRMLALYGLLYASLAASIRRRLGEGAGRNWMARLLLLILFVVGSAAPALVGEMVGRGGWTPLQILNIFWTIDARGDSTEATKLLAALTLVALMFQVLPMMRGLREVYEASKRRAGHAG
jgi:hypothetical protein